MSAHDAIPALICFASDEAPRCVHDVFAARVLEFGDEPAIVAEGGILTYSELNERANATAHHLIEAGIRPGEGVALCADRSFEMVVTLLGLLKAGAFYVPIVPTYPEERIGFMLRDSGARLVVTQASYSRLFADSMRRVSLDEVATLTPRSDPPDVPSDPEALAYVMYTSGSTGEPKGAGVPHRAIERLSSTEHCVPTGPKRVILHAAPIAFDASTFEVWGPLLAGGTVALHDEAVPTASGLARAIEKFGVTGMWLTAALFNMVVDQDPQAFSNLQHLITGGEALSVEHVRRAQRALPHLELFNGYGPTETTTFATCFPIPRPVPEEWSSIPIGRAIRQTKLYILGEDRLPVTPGEPGELYIGGFGVATGYLNRPDLTEQAFVEGPSGERVYKTGDLVRLLEVGAIDYLGRIDQQVKIRGYRIEPGEIEHAITRVEGVQACAVTAQTTAAGEKRLLAYWVADESNSEGAESESKSSSSERRIREALERTLPDYMVPAVFTQLPQLPVTGNGKLDYRALPPPSSARPDLREPFVAPSSPLEVTLGGVFAELLELDRVGRNDNFFELGGSSLLAVKLAVRLSQKLEREVSAVLLFELPTIARLAARLEGGDASSQLARQLARTTHRGSADAGRDIAIIGMAGRFPGSRNVEEFWQNLARGREGITFFSESELHPRVPSTLKADANYVPARGIIADYDKFDAPFFGITKAEALLMDPQQRVLLEVAWETLESAGYVPEKTDAVIGIYAGKYNDTYFSENVVKSPEAIEQFGAFNTMLANEKDYVATRTAYALNLTGPAVSVHTACSTSLVCVVQAMQALRNGDCDMALAGGVSITVPVESGYLHQEGTMLSADGHTKTFSRDSTGTVFSDGASMVLLKRLDDAIRDGDNIRAVVRGGAINNDGGNKASLTAPSVQGQALCIARAHRDARVGAHEISYIEAHGTATRLGDPVEFEALKQAFALSSEAPRACGVGSVKSNVGHTVIAAGTTGLIKTALALENGVIPATLFFDGPNPELGIEGSAFHVVTQPEAWSRGEAPRLAGVSSFGVGGTNAHVVVGEAPARAPDQKSRREEQLLFVSGRTEEVLKNNLAKLADYLERSTAPLEDVAYTLHAGRKSFPHRAALVCSSARQGAELLRGGRVPCHKAGASAPRVVFLFPGQGSQYPRMGATLYKTHSLFRSLFDHCAGILEPHLGAHLGELVFAEGMDEEEAAERLRKTEITQPALFTIEYCLARVWQQMGLTPDATIGHSVGEFVSAAMAGVFSLEDALTLVAERGRLMGAQPPGAMLSVRLGAQDVEPRLSGGLCLASDNSPKLCVVAGPTEEIASFEERLEADGIASRRLVTSHAFHSSMMDDVTEPFLALVRDKAPRAPKARFISTATGTWITDEQATDPGYWARHLREPVRFSGGFQTLLEEGGPLVLLEVGPRQVLSTLVLQHEFDRAEIMCTPSLGNEDESSLSTFLSSAGKLLTRGLELNPEALHGPERRRRVELPTYAFDHKRYFLEPDESGVSEGAGRAKPAVGETTPAASESEGASLGRRGSVVKEQLRVMQAQLDVLLARRRGGA